VNEYSARYSIMEREFYIPKPEHMAVQAQANKQGRGEILDEASAAEATKILTKGANEAFDAYEYLLGDEDGFGIGLARELARMNLPANTYTQWYWKVDLHNLFHFLRLRADPHAQYEIRVYAEAICELVKAWVPQAYSAFEDYRLNARQFSAPAMICLQRMMAGDHVNQRNSGMSKGEWSEFQAMIIQKATDRS
jgi:thymidylate synthase (FAD)